MSEEATPEELDQEEQIVRNWWKGLFEGRKPSAQFNVRWEATDEDLAQARRQGLEVITTENGVYEDTGQPIEHITVAQPGKFTSLLSEETLDRFRKLGLGERLDKVLGELGGKSIAQAMEYLNQYPRVDDEYPMQGNRERIEVAALEGVGFGYRPCCVESFIRAKYLGEEQGGPDLTDPEYGYSLCTEHAQTEGERREKEAK